MLLCRWKGCLVYDARIWHSHRNASISGVSAISSSARVSSTSFPKSLLLLCLHHLLLLPLYAPTSACILPLVSLFSTWFLYESNYSLRLVLGYPEDWQKKTWVLIALTMPSSISEPGRSSRHFCQSPAAALSISPCPRLPPSFSSVMSLSAQPFLATSASFSVTSSAVPRPLKRRASDMVDLPVEQGASATFHALPIQHTMLSSVLTAPTHASVPPSSAVRQQVSGLDPTTDDPTAVFLHPPFEEFQNNPEHPDGLTYLVLAEHPDWFLDARDYNALNNDNPDAIPYLSQLEPPRGWCPAKKKDLKHMGADGWPEGEEPRLRCTFCRRTYAGVNAKSMWRRHVYEKHKIAMANRREGTERVRGRNSNSMSSTPCQDSCEN